MKAFLDDGKIALKFGYNPKIIEQVKQISGREWIPLWKRWEIPLLKENIQIIKNIGFDTKQLEQDFLAQETKKKNEFDELRAKIKHDYPKLYEHQIDGTTKAIINEKLLIADETGIGKTIESLAAADYLLKNNKTKRIIVLCPKSIMEQWQREAKNFFDLDFEIVSCPYKQRKTFYKTKKHLIMTYDTAVNDIKDIHKMIQDETVLIMDEMTKVKNEKTKRSRGIKKIRPKYIFGLTGTPIETKLKDGFVIGTTLFPEWMNKNEFYNEYCVMEHNGYGNMVVGYRNVDRFMNRLMEIAISRKKKDVRDDMPDKLYYVRNIGLTKQQIEYSHKIKKIIRGQYESANDIRLEDCVLLQMLEDGTNLIKNSEAMSLRKLDRTAMTIESPKIDELKQILSEIQDKKVVIFVHFLGMIDLIMEKINESVMTVTSDNVITQIEKFKTNDKRILILTDSCLYGVDIPFASTLIHFDMLWNPAKMKQREERIYRITSPHDVKIFYLVSQGVEDYMFNYMKSKEELGEQATNMDIKKQLYKFLFR